MSKAGIKMFGIISHHSFPKVPKSLLNWYHSICILWNSNRTDEDNHQERQQLQKLADARKLESLSPAKSGFVAIWDPFGVHVKWCSSAEFQLHMDRCKYRCEWSIWLVKNGIWNDEPRHAPKPVHTWINTYSRNNHTYIIYTAYIIHIHI